MLYEVALLPDAFENSVHAANQGCSVVLKAVLRDLADNGLLADMHKSRWQKQVDKNIETLPLQLRRDVQKILSVLKTRNRLVRRPKSSVHPITEQDWLRVATELDNLHVIVASTHNAVENCDNLVELAAVLDSELWNNRDRTWKVPMDEAGYRTALTPLLRYARKLLLIDPYLGPGRANKSVVELCAELLGQGRSNPKSAIEIHARRGKDNDDDWFSQWQQFLEPLHLSYGHIFKVHLYQSPQEGQRFHDRYILTDQCGVSVPTSLGFLSGSTTGWNLMDFQVANTHRSDFESPRHPYLQHVAREPLVVPKI